MENTSLPDMHPHTPLGVRRAFKRLEGSPALEGLIHLWNGREAAREALAEAYRGVALPPHGVTVQTVMSGNRLYARAQAGPGKRPFDGKRTMSLGRAGSAEHREYLRRVERVAVEASQEALDIATLGLIGQAAEHYELVCEHATEFAKITAHAQRTGAAA